MSITIIAAISENGVIGQGGEIPWHLPEDLKRFKRLTMGHVIVMGRKTWESLPNRDLPGRDIIVLTRNEQLAPFISMATSVQALVPLLEFEKRDVYVCGGAEIYGEFLPLANRMEITRVHRNVWADSPDTRVFFPSTDLRSWKLTWSELHEGFTFETYEREKNTTRSISGVGRKEHHE